MFAGGVLGGVLRHAAHSGAQSGVRHQLAQFDPGVDLLVRGVIGKFRGGGQQAAAVGRYVQVSERLRHELMDDRAAFDRGQAGSPVHEGESFCSGSAAGDGAQHRLLRAQQADLLPQCVGVSRGHLRQGLLAVEYLPDRREAEPEVPQGPRQLQSGQGLRGEHAVSGRGPPGRRHQPHFGPVPDELHRQPGLPRNLADAPQHLVVDVHVPHPRLSHGGRVNHPATHLTCAEPGACTGQTLLPLGRTRLTVCPKMVAHVFDLLYRQNTTDQGGFP